jgi:hypothetical protein
MISPETFEVIPSMSSFWKLEEEPKIEIRGLGLNMDRHKLGYKDITKQK